MELSVIIPAYNESHRLGGTLESVGAWIHQEGINAEVVVVDNGSEDNTIEIAESASRQFPFISVISEPKRGKGSAVSRGMLFAHGKIRIFMDADNSTDIHHFERMRPYFLQGYQVVVGSLAATGSSIMRGGGEPFWRVLFGKLGNLWIQLLAVPGMWDTQRGFKAFTAKAAEDIFPRVSISGWGFDIETLAIARARGYKIREIPVTWKNDQESRVTIWSYPRTLWDALLVGFRRISGAYDT